LEKASDSLLQEAMALRRQGALAQASERYAQVLCTDPNNADALYSLAQLNCQAGQFADGIDLVRRLLALDPRNARAHVLHGMALAHLGKLSEALASYDRAIACQPELADAHGNRGDVLIELGRLAEAEESLNHALLLKPQSVENWCNRGTALFGLRRYDEALTCFERVVALNPDFAEAHLNLGNTLSHLGRYQGAIASYDRALALRPDEPDWLYNRGNALERLGRHAEAIASYEKAIGKRPNHTNALMGRATSLIALRRHEEAVNNFDTLLRATPNHVAALNGRGFALNKLNRMEEALDAYDRALRIDPGHVETLNNRGVVFSRLARYSDAIAMYDRALAMEPGHVYARLNRAKALEELGRYDEAISEYEKIRAENPGRNKCLGDLAHCLLVTCNWSKLSGVTAECFEAAADPTQGFDPYTFLAFDSVPQQQLACAQNWMRAQGITSSQRNFGDLSTDRLRLAYLSADFHPHPVSYLTAELFEIHDRKRFEVVGIAFTPDDHSAMRGRLGRAFDRLIDVSRKTDEQVAQLIRDLKIHIVIDLMGHTFNSRIGILAQRAAPIQVSYLGYPGTLGVDFIDYVVTDSIVAPFHEQAFYTEKLAHLPDTFQVNDSKRAVSSHIPSRNEELLPDDAFVFCCFNNSRKISARIFNIWMRLLQRVEGSVLWLSRSNDYVVANLQREARARGIDPQRLIFATQQRKHSDHLARVKLADLFLDTLPFNAATTASDALWAGVPVLTCTGQTYIGRNGASLLHAVGLPELVTTSLEDYEALALTLATDRALMQTIRGKLERNRRSSPLFDTDRFRRHIEAAYVTMVEIWERGEGPQSFSVVPRRAHSNLAGTPGPAP
jgi:protein O-GlcNAc transferase